MADEKIFDAFLSHSHSDAQWVEAIACRLVDECGFEVWLDKWILVPGQKWQQEMAKGLEEASSCVIFIGANTPRGWFEEEIQRALDIQTKDPNYRVIPVLLPDSNEEDISGFLSLRTWVDFRNGADESYALHVLRQGIRGEPVGRWAGENDALRSNPLKKYEQKIQELERLGSLGVHKDVIMEYQRKILDKWFSEEGE